MILQIATALAIGAYVVLSRDAAHRRPDANHNKTVTPGSARRQGPGVVSSPAGRLPVGHGSPACYEDPSGR
jgi:hypothetical protein